MLQYPVCPGHGAYIGMSPSGKAPDFDSGIRRFESCHPSQINDQLAQPVEQLPFKQWVRGSSPRRVTKKRKPHLGFPFFNGSRGTRKGDRAKRGKKVSGGHFFSPWESPRSSERIPQGCGRSSGIAGGDSNASNPTRRGRVGGSYKHCRGGRLIIAPTYGFMKVCASSLGEKLFCILVSNQWMVYNEIISKERKTRKEKTL